jgi:hypothetical protein
MQDAIDARKHIEAIVCREYWPLPSDGIISRCHGDTMGQAT